MLKVLILCTGNSCRSQMAEAWVRHFNPKIKVYSGGTHPEPVNKYAVRVMNEKGIDISKYRSNNVKEYVDVDFDFILTVCDKAKQICPNFHSASALKIHHSFTDPANAKGSESKKLVIYRDVRDQLKKYIIDFLRDYCS